ncbi:GIN domain-containing protein [Marinigracilibium pacificum]|uniref:DUF2807 domain-containing protein n=1 Tax=Marinigracilibium pacificum TaxID=2729599 RepID=A0A848IXF4_9BACT|nr:DUF2807 domain-containing protein [Marinigracilibium pacificum]NMM47848.1 DUF2807 domain-containing protein [Marinigracilibium pacificum]
MKKQHQKLLRIMILSIVSFSLILTSCDDEDLCLTGSGTVSDYELDLVQFNNVSLEGPINLRITQGSTQKVVIAAEPSLYGPLYHYVRDGRLFVGYDENVRCFNTDFGVWVNITVPDLNSIHVDGKSEIESSGDLILDDLHISNSGECKVSLTGTIDDQEFDTEGKISVFNSEVSSKNVSIDVEGSGYFEVNCQEIMNIDVEGSATIRYTGKPQIYQDVEGALELIDAN